MLSLGDVDTIYSRFSKLARRFRQCSANPDLYDEIQRLSSESDAAYQNLINECERLHLEENQVREIQLRVQNIRKAIDQTESQLRRLHSRNSISGSNQNDSSRKILARLRRDLRAGTSALVHTNRDAAELNDLRERIRFEMNQITRIRLTFHNQGSARKRNTS